MQVEIRHLRMLKAIVDEGTMTRAADVLNVTQSALSHQLQEIEGRLRTPLFLRVNRRLLLTDAGRRLLDSAESILAELSRAEREIESLASGGTGVLTISTECYTCYHWLPSILSRFREIQPTIDVEIAAEATMDPFRALLDQRIDLAVTLSTPDDSQFLSRPIFHDEVVMISAADHPFTKKKYLSAEDIAPETLLLHTSPDDSFMVRDVLAPAGLVPARFKRLGLTEAIVEMAAAGLGVSPVATWAVREQVARGSVASSRIGPHGYWREWYVTTLRSQQLGNAIDDFVKLLQDESPALLGGGTHPEERCESRSCPSHRVAS